MVAAARDASITSEKASDECWSLVPVLLFLLLIRSWTVAHGIAPPTCRIGFPFSVKLLWEGDSESSQPDSQDRLSQMLGKNCTV